MKNVTLSGSVVLKIIKHCSEAFPESVAGSVLGLDVGESLEVTHRCAAVSECMPDRVHGRCRSTTRAYETVLPPPPATTLRAASRTQRPRRRRRMARTLSSR